MQKRYYMFIPLDIDKDKSSRFVVETDGIPERDLFFAKVVARNRKAYYYIGHESSTWCNPIADLKNGHKPSFIPINKDEVEKKFEEFHLD